MAIAEINTDVEAEVDLPSSRPAPRPGLAPEAKDCLRGLFGVRDGRDEKRVGDAAVGGDIAVVVGSDRGGKCAAFSVFRFPPAGAAALAPLPPKSGSEKVAGDECEAPSTPGTEEADETERYRTSRSETVDMVLTSPTSAWPETPSSSDEEDGCRICEPCPGESCCEFDG